MSRMLRKIYNTLKAHNIVQPRIMVNYSNENGNQVTEDEIRKVLHENFPNSSVKVEDVSGGCGAMFNISIESGDFKGLPIPKQHRIVYQVLQKQIANIHGLHLETKVPS